MAEEFETLGEEHETNGKPAPPSAGHQPPSLSDQDSSPLAERFGSYTFFEASLDFIVLAPGDVIHVPQSGWASMYIVEEGVLHLGTGGGAEQINRGGIGAVPSGRAHILRSSLEAQRSAPTKVPQSFTDQRAARQALREGGAILFRLRVSNATHPVPSFLPLIVKMSPDEVGSQSLLTGTIQVVRELITSQDDPISMLMICRFADIIALVIVKWILALDARSFFERLDSGFDDRIRSALRIIHTEPEKDWTVETLAKEVNLSRASFAKRFKRAVAIGPIEYMTRIRINLATGYLQSVDWPIYAIAQEVGYRSETAFISAFKRQVGVSPGKFRKASRDRSSIEEEMKTDKKAEPFGED